LIVDGAYAPPVPNIAFQDLHIPWTDRTIFITSLSKAGLAGERLGVVIAPIPMVRQLLDIQSKVTILASRLVQFVVNEMLRLGIYQELSQRVIRPTYVERHKIARGALETSFPDDLPYYVFQSGGSPFLWLWFDELPISTNTLFFELLKKNLIVAPSSVFYLPSLHNWPHAHRCVRIGLLEDPATIEKAIHILSRTVREKYGNYR
jgi:valine--pyruvate aminotransferase